MDDRDDGAAAARNAMRPYYDEIARRGRVAAAEVRDTDYFDRVREDGDDMPFAMEEQSYVLFSLSHRGFAPVSESARAPALRVYGTFPDQESALAQADLVREHDPKCSLLLNRTHEWVVGASDPARMADAQHIAEKRDALLAAHRQERAQSDADFQSNVSKRQMGALPASNSNVEDERVVDLAAVEGKVKARRKLPSGVQVCGQKLAALSVVRDPSDDCEFLFTVYACFEDAASVDRWVRNVGGNEVTQHDIDVISTCEWVYPQDMRDGKASKHAYRSAELHSIMNNYKSSPEEIKRVERDSADRP
jgi:hypothetical protein